MQWQFFSVCQQKFISVVTLENYFEVILFNKVAGSVQMMEHFSDKHRSQRFEPHSYCETFLGISHERLLLKPWSFKFHTCFNNSVSLYYMAIPCFELPFRSSIVNRYGVVVVTTAQLHSTKPGLRFCTGSNPARGVSEIRDGENLWQWSQLEIRLNTFRRSTIPQKQFIIIIKQS